MSFVLFFHSEMKLSEFVCWNTHKTVIYSQSPTAKLFVMHFIYLKYF